MVIGRHLFLILLIATLNAAREVRGQNDEGFISLDCGLPSGDGPYNESGITYKSDSSFINTGEIQTVRIQNISRVPLPLRSLRSFPDGDRNCYSVNVSDGQKYLIRTWFLYGNYDGQSRPPSFDLFLGQNLWTRITLQEINALNRFELIHIATSEDLELCLVRSGETDPFISAIELRPIPSEIYNSTDRSIKNVDRLFFSERQSFVAFPDDIYDRFWTSEGTDEVVLTTNRTIDSTSPYDPPQLVMQTAITAANGNQTVGESLTDNDPTAQYFIFLHFAEIEELKDGESREFDIILNGELLVRAFSPPRTIVTIFNQQALTSDSGRYTLQLRMTNNSTLPPILNAFETYKVAF